LLDRHVVGIGLVGGDRTLSDSVYSVHLVRAKLTDAVPMNGSTQIGDLVRDVDDQVVSPTHLELWARVSAVDNLSQSFDIAIRCNSLKVNLEPVLHQSVMAILE